MKFWERNDNDTYYLYILKQADEITSGKDADSVMARLKKLLKQLKKGFDEQKKQGEQIEEIIGKKNDSSQQVVEQLQKDMENTKKQLKVQSKKFQDLSKLVEGMTVSFPEVVK